MLDSPAPGLMHARESGCLGVFGLVGRGRGLAWPGLGLEPELLGFGGRQAWHLRAWLALRMFWGVGESLILVLRARSGVRGTSLHPRVCSRCHYRAPLGSSPIFSTSRFTVRDIPWHTLPPSPSSKGGGSPGSDGDDRLCNPHLCK